MNDMQHTFHSMDGLIWRAVGQAKQRELELINLRVSPAALDVMRSALSPHDWEVDLTGYRWRGMRIVIEAGLPIGDPSEYQEIKLCVEAKQHGEHGRYFYFECDTSRLPRIAPLPSSELQSSRNRIEQPY